MRNIKENLKIWGELFFSFFKIGCVTFGGGLAILPILKHDLVHKKKWLTEKDIIDYFAIGQCTPGIIAVNVATFSGYKRAGLLGGIISTLGIITPSLIIIMILANLISSFSEIIWLQKAFRGMQVAVVVLLARTLYDISRKTLTDIYTLLIAILAFISMAFFNVPGVFVVLGSALLGYALYSIKDIREKK